MVQLSISLPKIKQMEQTSKTASDYSAYNLVLFKRYKANKNSRLLSGQLKDCRNFKGL